MINSFKPLELYEDSRITGRMEWDYERKKVRMILLKSIKYSINNYLTIFLKEMEIFYLGKM